MPRVIFGKPPGVPAKAGTQSRGTAFAGMTELLRRHSDENFGNYYNRIPYRELHKYVYCCGETPKTDNAFEQVTWNRPAGTPASTISQWRRASVPAIFPCMKAHLSISFVPL